MDNDFWLSVISAICVVIIASAVIAAGMLIISSIGDHKEYITIHEKFTFTGLYFVKTTTGDVYRLSVPMNSDSGMWKRLQLNETYLVILDGSGDRIRGIEFDAIGYLKKGKVECDD